MAKKENMTLSFCPETKDRLRAYAKQKHTTVSQAITDWIWTQKIQTAPTPEQLEQETAIKETTGVEEK